MNNFIEVCHLGRITRVTNGDEMQKAVGVDMGVGREIIMTDESGALIGYGHGVDALYKSMPVIQALKEKPLLKAKIVMRNEKPLHKSVSAKCPQFNDWRDTGWKRLDAVGKS